MILETRELYERFRRAGGDRPCAPGPAPAPLLSTSLGLAIRRVPFKAVGLTRLLDEDRSIAENASFEVPLFEPLVEPLHAPTEGAPHARLVVLVHGLNETLYNKLFPWAASLCARLQTPVALFPMAMHVTRRPHAWLELGREVFVQRAALPDNATCSPFNAVLSARIEASPERFLRAGLATCDDLVALAAQVHTGQWPGLRAGASVDFIGYSAGGYAALCLLAGPRGAHDGLRDARLCLVAAGADAGGIDVESLFILDRRAAGALTRSLAGHTTHAFGDEEAAVFTALYTGGGADIAARLGSRLSALSFEGDRVISPTHIARNLGAAKVAVLPAGLHEYPFSLSEPLPGDYTPTVGRRLLAALARASDVPAAFAPVFAHFIDTLAEHLTRPRATDGPRPG